MNFRVVYTLDFRRDVEVHVGWLEREQVGERTIADWYERLFAQLDQLAVWPHRSPIDDAYTQRQGVTTRKMNFGDYLIFYPVDDAQHQVNLIAFIHGARDRDG